VTFETIFISRLSFVFDSFVVSSFPWETLKLYQQKKKISNRSIVIIFGIFKPYHIFICVCIFQAYRFTRHRTITSHKYREGMNISDKIVSSYLSNISLYVTVLNFFSLLLFTNFYLFSVVEFTHMLGLGFLRLNI
jgi:hypothetical protein